MTDVDCRPPSAPACPPLNCLAAACAGALLLRHRTGRLLLAAGLVSLIVLGLPVTSRLLLFSLEQNLPLTPSLAARPSAIVILSGDETAILVNNSRSYAPGGLTLEREAAGAQLAHQTGLPILVSGGQIHRDSQPLATLMQASLQRSFGLVPAWAEKSSVDTWRNAQNSAAILHRAGIQNIYLVTHAWHMRRALIAFRVAGLTPTAAPTYLDAPPNYRFDDFIPSTNAWENSYYAIHEWIGCAWYAIKT